MKIDKIMKFNEGSGQDFFDLDELKASKKMSEKPEKEVKVFKVGDILLCNNTSSKKLSAECMEFLKTYSKFKVLAVNDHGKIDVGYRTPDGATFFFSTSRFDYKNPPPKPPEPKVEVEKEGPKKVNLDDRWEKDLKRRMGRTLGDTERWENSPEKKIHDDVFKTRDEVEKDWRMDVPDEDGEDGMFDEHGLDGWK